MNKIKQRLLLLPLLLLALTFSGCGYQTINADEIALAVWYCKDKGGVSEIRERFDATTFITCKAPFSSSVVEWKIRQEYLEYLKEGETK